MLTSVLVNNIIMFLIMTYGLLITIDYYFFCNLLCLYLVG